MNDTAALKVTLLRNTAPKEPLLYQTDDPAVNELELKIGNHSGADIKFVKDHSAITIGFASLLTSGELAKVIVSDGWTCKPVAGSFADFLELRPTGNDVTVAAEDELYLTIKVPSVSFDVVGGKAGDTISIDYSDIKGTSDDAVSLNMFVDKLPAKGSRPLPVGVSWMKPPAVEVSRHPQQLISNSLSLAITNTYSNQPLLAPGTKGSVSFQLSFITVPANTDLQQNAGRDALTDESQARQIRMEVQGDGWTMHQPRDTGPLIWELAQNPDNQVALGAHKSVGIMINNVSTLLPPFATTLYVQAVVNGIPEFRGVIKQLEFPKVAIEPRIEWLKADNNTIEPNGSVTLSWKTKGLDRLELTWAGEGIPNGKAPYDTNDVQTTTRTDTLSRTRNYWLKGFYEPRRPGDPGVTDVQHEMVAVEQPPPVIKSFTIDKVGVMEVVETDNVVTATMDIETPGRAITLKWEVSGATSLKLNEALIEGTSVTWTISGSREYILEASNKDGVLVQRRVEVVAREPKINSFQVYPAVWDETMTDGVSLSWDVTGAGASNMRLDPSQLAIPQGRYGNMTAKPVFNNGIQNYTLYAKNGDGAEDHSSVKVISLESYLRADRSFFASSHNNEGGETLAARIDLHPDNDLHPAKTCQVRSFGAIYGDTENYILFDQSGTWERKGATIILTLPNAPQFQRELTFQWAGVGLQGEVPVNPGRNLVAWFNEVDFKSENRIPGSYNLSEWHYDVLADFGWPGACTSEMGPPYAELHETLDLKILPDSSKICHYVLSARDSQNLMAIIQSKIGNQGDVAQSAKFEWPRIDEQGTWTFHNEQVSVTLPSRTFTLDYDLFGWRHHGTPQVPPAPPAMIRICGFKGGPGMKQQTYARTKLVLQGGGN